MWIVKASLKNPYAVIVLALMIIFVGNVARSRIPVDILPVFKAPAVEVLTYFQGMPASSIEKTITNRIERWVNQAPGAASVESKSMPGVSVVKIYFRDDIDPNAALTLTTSLAQSTLPTLPPNTLPPVTLPFDPTGTMPLGILTVSNPTMNEAHVKDLARIDVRNMLGSVPGCVAPVVVGGQDRTVLIYLKPRELEARNLSALDVVKAVQQSNLMVTPGTAYFGKHLYLLDTNGMADKVKELNEIPIATQHGVHIYLKDVAEARDSSAIQTSRVHIDGRKQVYVPIYRQQGASSLDVARAVRAHIDFMKERLPAGTKLEFVMDQSVYVQEAIDSLIHEGVIGAVLVAIMILIFLGNWRMTVIASMSIPLAIFCAIIGLYATGNTINAMTLGGLALAIGPLVDNAIVVLENTHRHHTLGKSRIRAAYDGAVEVAIPVLVATSATIIVLCPLALMPGISGFLFKPLTLAVAFAMISSFLLSITFVPMLCAKWLGGHATAAGDEHVSHGPGARIHQRIEAVINGATRRYERILDWALAHKAGVLTTVGVLFVGSLGLVFLIGKEFFPQVDAGMITLYVRGPSNMRLDTTEKRVTAVEHFLEEHVPARERKTIVTEIGLDPDWSSAYTQNSGQQDAIIRLQLTDQRRYSAQQYAIQLRQLLDNDSRFNDLRFAFDTGGMISTALNYGVSSPIDIQIEGGTADQAMDLAKEMKRRISATHKDTGAPLVRGAADVRLDERRDAPYLVFQVDRKQAADEGLSAEDVILQLVAAMNSSVSIKRSFWIDNESGNQYFVAVQGSETPGARLNDVLNIPTTGTHQHGSVKLGQLVKLMPRRGAVEIHHVQLYRTMDVLINTANRDIGSVASDINKQIGTLKQDYVEKKIQAAQNELDGLAQKTDAKSKLRRAELTAALHGWRSIRWEMKGEYERMVDSWSNLGQGMIAAIILVYLLMVPLFRSFLGPFIILFTVPLGLIGVVTMLFITHTTLNVQSEMGVIFLVGIVVSNGVLLVDFANKQRKLGAPVDQAIRTAAVIRFRPIMMTFLATFLDLTPMAIGLGKGSEANVPLARAVVGGLLTSTFLTLLVVPILFTLLIKNKPAAEADVEGELGDESAAGRVLVPADGSAALTADGISHIHRHGMPNGDEVPVASTQSPGPERLQ